jgi:hypothetical protein
MQDNTKTQSQESQPSAVDQLRQAVRMMRLELDYPLNPTDEWTRARGFLREAIRRVSGQVPYVAPPSELLATAEALLLKRLDQ